MNQQPKRIDYWVLKPNLFRIAKSAGPITSLMIAELMMDNHESSSPMRHTPKVKPKNHHYIRHGIKKRKGVLQETNWSDTTSGTKGNTEE